MVRNTVFVLLLWIFLVFSLGYWSSRQELKFTRELIRNEAVTHLSRDKAFRYWASAHGGVYVPVTEDTTPSPYLSHIPARDILYGDGLKLTLMNPAWMLRELMDEYEAIYGVKGHITSLNPIREENSPDPWEKEALAAFEEGVTEYSAFTEIGGAEYFRFMKPLKTVERCLKCHEYQGYKTGDIRGGVSVSISTEPYFNSVKKIIRKQNFIFIFLGLAGFILIVSVFFLIRRRNLEKIKSQKEMDMLKEELVRKDKLDTLGNLASGMAHEINNPLGGIIQASSVLSSRFGSRMYSKGNLKAAEEAGVDLEAVSNFMQKREIDRLIGIINEDGKKIVNLISNLTVFSKDEISSESSITVDELFRRITGLLGEYCDVNKEYDLNRISIIKNVQENVPAINCGKCLQALYNIALNGVQTLLENNIKSRELVIGASFDHKRNHTVFTISDNGPGIDGNILKHINEPFFTTKEVGRGKGLGLSISYYIITEFYHGEMTVDSSPGEGTSFTVSIPVPDI